MNTNRSKLEELKEMGWNDEDIGQLLKEIFVKFSGLMPSSNTETELPMTQRITIIMRKMGFKTNMNGFIYLREAINYCIENGTNISMTKELYPAIAEKFNTTPSKVERTIRHSIENVFHDPSPDLIEFAGNTVDSKKGKLTNLQFIALMTDMICQNLL